MMDWDLSEYEDPNLYDLENQGNPELPLLLEWTKKLEIKGEPLLDLACGTGRTALPLAEAGYSVIGVDLHAGMLEQARRKTPAGADIRWVQQDLTQRSLRDDRRWLIWPALHFSIFLPMNCRTACFNLSAAY